MLAPPLLAKNDSRGLRGFGHVKEMAVEIYHREVAAGLQAYAVGEAGLPHVA